MLKSCLEPCLELAFITQRKHMLKRVILDYLRNCITTFNRLDFMGMWTTFSYFSNGVKQSYFQLIVSMQV